MAKPATTLDMARNRLQIATVKESPGEGGTDVSWWRDGKEVASGFFGGETARVSVHETFICASTEFVDADALALRQVFATTG